MLELDPRIWQSCFSTEVFSVSLAVVILSLLFAGGFSWLDHLNKIMMAILALATLLAFVPVAHEIDSLSSLIVPTLPADSIVLVAAILGWMPTGICRSC